MPIFRSLDLERMLIYQEIFFIEIFGKVLFFTQLSYHLMCKLLKKSYMLSSGQPIDGDSLYDVGVGCEVSYSVVQN